MEAGLTVAEITMTVPGAIEAIASVARRFGDKVLVGAGTVTDAETVGRALDAGASYIGATTVSLEVARNAKGAWTVGGAPATNLNGCDDIDLGFTPATNLLPIRKLGLAVGATAAVRAAWVRFPELTTEVLDQVYTRIAPDQYLYESAGGSFHRELRVHDTGFVLDYPGLWRVEGKVVYPDRVE